MTLNQRVKILIQRLSERYPDVQTALTWDTPWQLLVATVLSAQCTDKRVNEVTPVFFNKWPHPSKLAVAETSEVENVIRSTGLYKTKARHLVQAAHTIMDQFEGQIPQNMKDLTTLPGVGRKTANIILSNGFNKHEGIAVDTHVKRIAYRLGLTASSRPDRIEKDLIDIVPQSHWSDFNHLLVSFGREVCTARSPSCPQCELRDICPKKGVN